MPAAPASSTALAARVGRARLGVSLMFFTNGVLYSALLPRYPEIKRALDLSDTAFGLTVVAFPAGAIAAAAAGASLIRRFGAPRVTAVGSVLLAVAMGVAGVSGTVALLFAALVLGGVLDAVVDAAQNVHGIAVERLTGRSIINSLHAIWSLGAASGGVIGAAAAAADVAIGLQMVVNGVVWAAVALLAARLSRLPHGARPDAGAASAGDPAGDPATTTDGAERARPAARRAAYRLLVPLVLLAVCGTLLEDVANNWVVLLLGRETAAPAVVAGLGLTVVLVSQFVGRLLGDPMTDRWGRGAVARAGGLLVAGGLVPVVAGASYPFVLLGFALMGFGSATLVPAAFAAADRVPGLPVGTGVALTGWLMRLGFLATSPLVGVLSDATTLRTAMVVPLVAGLVAAVLAERTRRRDRVT
ncbi:MFS transporter [Nocardioides sp. ChNu-99]|uniref:MFS transporter n=1 Tax=Nocardioides sp. ChNu-99 TaxID=2839897 RepID=UPI0024072F0C|nr:MFS transporter [Nocardioides sp. ChNu-99]MDF9717454.1 MFS transporter [Nocardioides sp. ChNu-99]